MTSLPLFGGNGVVPNVQPKPDKMTVLETRFMEQVPRLLQDLLNETKMLRREISALRTELAEKKVAESPAEK